MSGPPETDVARVRRWCWARAPEHIRDQVRVEVDVAARHLTIVECRPPWRPDFGTGWTRGPAYTAIKRLIDSLRDQPLRRPRLTRPIGRMLREFELALANGSAETSAELLREIEALGGISLENLAYLQIRRLARLGQNDALLADGLLPTIVYSEPPMLNAPHQ